MKRTLYRLCIAGLLCAVTSSARADEVTLVDGGRVRGTIVEETPDGGVKVLLKDGTTFVVPPSNVKDIHYGQASKPEKAQRSKPPRKPRPQVAQGTVSVSVTSGSGDVYVEEVDAPIASSRRLARVTRDAAATLSLPEGRWNVEVRFDEGGTDARDVSVDKNTTASITLTSWLTTKKVVHFGMIGSAGVAYLGAEPMLTARLFGFADLPLAPACNLRLGATLGGSFGRAAHAGHSDGSGEILGVAEVVFNAPGWVYRPYVGISVGVILAPFSDGFEHVLFPARTADADAIVSAELSALHFSFGSTRQFDLDFGGSLGARFETVYSGDPSLAFGARGGFGGVIQ